MGEFCIKKLMFPIMLLDKYLCHYACHLKPNQFKFSTFPPSHPGAQPKTVKNCHSSLCRLIPNVSFEYVFSIA